MSLITKVFNSPDKAFKKLQQIVDHSVEDTYRWMFQRSVWSSIINEHEIRIVGMRRTGNHALLGWMRAQAEGVKQTLNNLEVGVNPYRYKYEMLRDYHAQYQWSIAQLRPLAKGALTHKDWLFYTYEDHALNQIVSSKFERKHDLYLGKSRQRTDVLIMRDPFNLFASRMKSNMMSLKRPNHKVVDLWLDYAREYLNETQYLTHNKVCVNYNLWVQNRDYREQIARQLGLEFTDAGIDDVSGCGGGSSFEGRDFVGKARQMPVLDRWQHFMHDPSYQALFQDERLTTYSEQIFGHIPGTETLLKTQQTTPQIFS